MVIEGSSIGEDSTRAHGVDAAEATLLPGLIDACVHLHVPQNLRTLAAWRFTTGLDRTNEAAMGTSRRERTVQRAANCGASRAAARARAGRRGVLSGKLHQTVIYGALRGRDCGGSGLAARGPAAGQQS
jgi:imidazolonepropionase-like amidohydrolase